MRIYTLFALLALPLATLAFASHSYAADGAAVWKQSCSPCHSSAAKFKGAAPADLEKKLLAFSQKEQSSDKAKTMQKNIQSLSSEQMTALTLFMSTGGEAQGK
jgi:mono/diheme cytochrome c family protein